METNEIIKHCNFKDITIRKLIAIVFLTSIIGAIPFIFQDGELLPVICSEVLIIITLLWCFKFNRTNILLLFKDFKNKLNIKEMCFLVLFSLFFGISSIIFIPSIISLFDSNMANEVFQDTNEVFNLTNNALLIFILTCILAPIIEELTFRAIIFKRLSIHMNVFWGIILSSVFFALQHPTIAFLDTFMFAVINCLLYLKYKNILFPMLLHFLCNSILTSNFSIPFIDDGINFTSISSATLTSYIVVTTTIMTIMLILFFKFYRKNKDVFSNSTFINY